MSESLISCPFVIGLASTFVKIGKSESEISRESSESASASLAGAMSGEWKAPLTFNWTVILAPDAFAESITDFTAAGEPEITTCPGEL